MNIYLSAAYSRREELSSYAERLNAIPWVKVTSSWHNKPVADKRTFPKIVSLAETDVDGVLNSDMVACFTGGGTHGGYHVEFGIAIGLCKTVVVVGDAENIFHYLPHIGRFNTFDEFLAFFKKNEKQVDRKSKID